MVDEFVEVNDGFNFSCLFGSCDENINFVKKEFNVSVVNRDGRLKICGDFDNVAVAKKVIETMVSCVEKHDNLDRCVVKTIIYEAKNGNLEKFKKFFGELVCLTFKGTPIFSKTVSQKNYVESIEKNSVTFGVGPAGTGKTFLAVALAVCALKKRLIEKIVITRPIVEAGESLGFLPGDLQSKIDPYLRPLYDALLSIVGVESFNKSVERKIIEIAPLAYMRGRTLNNSFIILDEAQNTTSKQMKMFLTRLGFGSKVVVTGDITQIDLPNNQKSGLVEAIDILKNVEDISVVMFKKSDIVRHELVHNIIKAYDELGL